MKQPKKKPRTYYCGYFRGRPHVSTIADMGIEFGTGIYLFHSKKRAIDCGFEQIRKVRIVEVK